MDEISLNDLKRIELDILKFINEICEQNSIQYSLIGGSLIGAIRHNGFIPWDDDIDIILTKENYEKLKKAMNEQNGIYKMMNIDYNESYYYPFAKIVDTRTSLVEDGLKKITDFGIFVDVFVYYGIPSDQKKKNFHYKKIKFLQQLIAIYAINDFKTSRFLKRAIKRLIKILLNITGIKWIINYRNKILEKFDPKETGYAISNWPIYGIDKEVMLYKNIINTKKHKFESINSQVFCNYDNILKTTFGDYMKLPPKSQRNPKHNLHAKWKIEEK